MAPDLVGGRYRLLEVIGTGGMGRVWLADDELLHRRVAVKEIATPPEISTSQMIDRQLHTMREARAAARIGLGVLSALRAAHAGGVLHRDVKPHNVLLAANGRVVLTDFGLAVVRGVDEVPDPLLGSPHFVAPERLRSEPAAAPADLWSLGATLYAAVEGRAPFARATTAESLTALLDEAPTSPEHPGPLDPVLAGLLIKEAARRLTADQAEPMLRRIADRAIGVVSVVSAPAADPPAPTRPARSTRIALAIAAALLAGSVGTALAVDHPPDAAPPLAAPSASASASTAECRPGDATAGSVVTPNPGKHRYALPTGWLWYGDRTGLAVAVPQGWIRAVDGPRTCFRDPGAARSLGVDTAVRVGGSPVGYLEESELSELTAGALPGYRAIGIDALPLRPGGADWEFSWQPAAGPRLHERRVLLSMGHGRTYLIAWVTAEPDWTINEPFQQLMLASLG